MSAPLFLNGSLLRESSDRSGVERTRSVGVAARRAAFETFDALLFSPESRQTHAAIRAKSGLMKRLALILLGTVIVCAIGWGLWPGTALLLDAKADLVVVRKSARLIELYRGAELLKAYSVSLGRHPVGNKQQQGDGRTPEGEYRLDYRNPNSSFHKALHISYPKSDDVAAARLRCRSRWPCDGPWNEKRAGLVRASSSANRLDRWMCRCD
jgi:hypothetical protein